MYDFSKLREAYTKKVAKDLCSVQPMPSFTKEQYEVLFESGMSLGEILYRALGAPEHIIKKIKDEVERRKREVIG